MQIHEHSRVGDIAAQSLTAVQVFEDYGIDYCCGGGQSIDAACREKAIEPRAVLQALEERLKGTESAGRDWNTAPLADLIAHIVSTHHEYLKLELPRIQQRLNAVSIAHRDHDTNGTLPRLQSIFGAMKDELEMHLHKEEVILFPAIEQLERASNRGHGAALPFGTLANPIRVMLAEHDGAGDALREMRALTNDYELPPYACSTYRALFQGLEAVERDLHLHIHLENNILFPRALALE